MTPNQMSQPEDSEDAGIVESSLSRGSAAASAGAFVRACRIDLPPDDVVEEIEFERFFRLNLNFLDLHAAGTNTTQIDRSRFNQAQAPAPVMGMDIGAMPVALYMPFTQQWRLDGYSRGRLVNSFTLGPGEDQTIELFTWDRFRSSLESSMSLESEQASESSGSRRDVTDVARDVSTQTGLELTTSGKVGFTVGVVNVNLGGGTSAKTAVNDAEKSTRSSIVEATSRSTNRVRMSRTLKVSESRESGREERVTRKLRNANACHTLTIPFFEVLANYHVETFVRTEELKLVLLIGSSWLSQLRSFDRLAIRVHQRTLTLALLDGTLMAGFDAARFLDARDRACKILCTGCTCETSASADTSLKEWDAVVAAARTVMTAVDTLRTRTVFFPFSVAWAVPAPAGGAGLNPMIVAAGIADIKRHLFDRALSEQAPRLVGDLGAVGITGGATAAVSPTQARALQTVISSLPGDTLAKLRNDPGLADKVGWEIYGAVLLFHPEVISAGVIAAIVRSDAGGLTTYDDEGLLDGLTQFATAYAEWVAKQAEADKNAETKAELARIADEERAARVLENFGLRETAEAEERLQALLEHLNDPRNIDHYRFAVWNERSGASEDKVTALALAGLVDPAPVGVVGDQLAVAIRLDREPRWAAFFAESVNELVTNTQRDERRYILPTAALYAEAIVGDCCACEDSIRVLQRLQHEELRLRNEHSRLENKRLEARLNATPPLLDQDCQVKASCAVLACVPLDDIAKKLGQGDTSGTAATDTPAPPAPPNQ